MNRLTYVVIWTLVYAVIVAVPSHTLLGQLGNSFCMISGCAIAYVCGRLDGKEARR